MCLKRKSRSCSVVLSHISWVVRLDGLKLAELIICHLDCPLAIQKIQVDVVRILKTTKQSKLRNQILKLLSKMLSMNKNHPKEQLNRSCQKDAFQLRESFLALNRPQPFTFQEISQEVRNL